MKLRTMKILMFFFVMTVISCDYSRSNNCTKEGIDKFNHDGVDTPANLIQESYEKFTQSDTLSVSDSSKITGIILDSLYQLNVKTITNVNSLSNEVFPRIEQEMLFLEKGKIIKTLNVTSIRHLQNVSKRNDFKRYRLTEVGIDSFGVDKFYVCYFYLSNGYPELYLYYDTKGLLLFLQKCDRNDCKTSFITFDKSKAKEYIEMKKSVKFIDVKGAL